MPGVSATPATVRQQDWRFAARAALIGVGCGIGIWLLTTLLSRTTISGSGWSLAGNGALIIPFGLGPAIVAAGWTAIILRMRGHPRWLQFGVASGLIALVVRALEKVLVKRSVIRAAVRGSHLLPFPLSPTLWHT